ncbi:MAG: HIT domain-containing protein [Piscirickettsiaceae bacterium]|nr:HIT domain-containing protein [Piscirickettsiaceae bacterium]
MYQLHPRLEQDTIRLGQFDLCDVLLMNDARYPWVILVPKRADITEVFQLSNDEQQQLMAESTFVARQLAEMVSADKMNIAMLGNVVSQLHIHHVARFTTDAVWPDPIWGKGQAVPYNEEESEAICQQLKAVLAHFLQDGA